MPEPERDDETARVRGLFLDLLAGALTHVLYWPPDVVDMSEYASDEWRENVREAYRRGDVLTYPEVRRQGRDWPSYGQTMVGLHRLRNVRACMERVLTERVPGDFIEAGTWRGGVAIFMRGLLQAYGIEDRIVFAADSFRGLPEPNPGEYPADTGDAHHTAPVLAVPRATVERNFELYGLLDDQVRFLEGWFADTLPTVRDRTWAVIRLDGDLYESTIDALTNLYPGLSVGGFVIVDDYAHPPCRQAVEDFRAEHGITDPIEEIDWTGAFWRRGS
jgi:O-methyltransferase